MRGKGINYDTGFFPGGVSSREQFDAGIVRCEMKVIADDLQCTAVRISGGDPARLSVAGELAAAAGLEVWFAPFPCELTTADLAPLFAECADRAEHLRRSGAAVVLVCGCELSLFGAGFLPGGTLYERIAGLQAGGEQPSGSPSRATSSCPGPVLAATWTWPVMVWSKWFRAVPVPATRASAGNPSLRSGRSPWPADATQRAGDPGPVHYSVRYPGPRRGIRFAPRYPLG